MPQVLPSRIAQQHTSTARREQKTELLRPQLPRSRYSKLVPPEPKPPREPGLCAPQRKQTCFRAKTLIPQSGQVQSPGFGLSSKRMTTGAVPVRAVPVSGRTGVVDTRMASSIPQRSVKRRLDGARSCVPTERDGRHARNVIEQPTSSIDNKRARGPVPARAHDTAAVMISSPL